MTVATYGTHTILKACVAGAVAAGADHLVMKFLLIEYQISL